MKILIIGLGYAGTRFLNALEQLQSENEKCKSLSIAYSDLIQKDVNIPYYRNITKALNDFMPDFIINSTNDIYHLDVIRQLTDFKGFLLNEKPFIIPQENIDETINSLSNINGFAMDMIERYSQTTNTLKEYVEKEKLKLLRINFIWGKNRLEDHRPTCGVGSEIIHSLDLIKYIIPKKNSKIMIKSASAVVSDFSISGTEIFDTVHLTALYQDVSIDGYSSFVNIDRQRNLDFTFLDSSNDLIYARIVFDTPVWDADTLKIWKRDQYGNIIELLSLNTFNKTELRESQGLYKVKRLLFSIIDYLLFGNLPFIPFCSIDEAVNLHNLIADIYHFSQIFPNTIYHPHSRRIITRGGGLETLG